MTVTMALGQVFELVVSLDPRGDSEQGLNGFFGPVGQLKGGGKALLHGLMPVVGIKVGLGSHLPSRDDPEKHKSKGCDSKG